MMPPWLLTQIAFRKFGLYRGGKTLITTAPEGEIVYHLCPLGHVHDYLSVYTGTGKVVACYCPTCTLEYPV